MYSKLIGDMLPSRLLVRAALRRCARKPPSMAFCTADDGVPKPLSHIDESGRAQMVDVGSKPASLRTATATATVVLGHPVFASLTTPSATSLSSPKGDVFTLAQTAGILAAKQTSSLIPLCHSVPLSSVSVDLVLDPPSASVRISATARTPPDARTGVEMEALTAASVAALTVYDMCKAAGKGIIIREVRLTEKHGGVTGDYSADGPNRDQSTTESDRSAA